MEEELELCALPQVPEEGEGWRVGGAEEGDRGVGGDLGEESGGWGASEGGGVDGVENQGDGVWWGVFGKVVEEVG